MRRREFSKSVYAEIVKRATRANEHGLRVVYCEGCGCQAKIWHVDHTIPDGLQVDKSKPLTATDGKVLCAGSPDSCHGKKTAIEDVPAIAKAKRREARHLGIKGAPTQLSGPSYEVRKQRSEERSKDRRGPGKLPVPAARILKGFEPATARKS